MKLHIKPYLISLIIILLILISSNINAQQKPRIIYLLMHDLGYGDLSFYHQQNINTPILDKLAYQEMHFMYHYAGASVCAPSRFSKMSGSGL